jgi:hypothetical protein
MSNNPEDWSTEPEDNAHLPLITKKAKGKTVTLSRDESNQIYANWKVASQVVEVRTVGTFNEFKGILTEAEEDAITSAAMSQLAIKKWYDLAIATNEIDLTNELVIGGMNAFVGAGLMTEARKNEILSHNFDA